MKKILLLATIISAAFAGNALNTEKDIILLPYPKSVSFEKNGPNAVQLTTALSYKIKGDCNDACKEFIKDNFEHSITTPLNKQKGLKNFRLSLFEAIDFPAVTPEISGEVKELSIELTGEQTFPKLEIGIDESYELSIKQTEITITAPNAFGVLHAFETLIQLIKTNEDTFYINELPILIQDEPRFKWRGLHVDPARNFILPDQFKTIVDSLASVKANVLHIHLTDGQQFTFESKLFPELSKKGMLDQRYVLTQDFLKELKAYGDKRGVIVFGEIDMPGHAASWGLGYPEVVANTWNYLVKIRALYGENRPALNPASPLTWEMIDGLVKELSEIFDYVHVGGDEVRQTAWSKADEYEEIKKFMAEKGLSNLHELEVYFNKYSISQVIKNNKTPIVWEEVYRKSKLDKSTIVHVWSDIRMLKDVVSKGYKAIVSAGYYLDKQMPTCFSHIEGSCVNKFSFWVWTNRDMYSFDFLKDVDEANLENVLGGEACSWGESVDENNLLNRIFQRYSAFAERFWSQKEIVDPESHEVRANYLRCLNLRRGVFKNVGPLYHSYCPVGDSAESNKV